MKHLQTEKIIINEQFGFRPRHSTVAQLLRITEHIALELNKKRFAAMILLDLQKAFDSVWHRGLIYKLHCIRIPEHIIGIIHNYLADRRFVVNFCGEKSSAYRVEAGVPQGSVLGPILFNIFINDIPKSRKSSLAVYADYTTHLRGAPLYSRVTCKHTLMTSCSSSWTGRCPSIQINRRRYSSPAEDTGRHRQYGY